MITVTFVRHGESTDNLRAVWAGWSDAPLSNHGMNQARAAGKYFADNSFRFDAIYASPLKRAHSTAEAIYGSQPEPYPPFTVDPDIREQHFGDAEGKPWSMHIEKDLSLEDHYVKGVYPVLHHRHEKFPGAESLADVQERAERAIQNLVLPHVWDSVRAGWKADGPHIALVSHGLCISELVAALLRLDTTSSEDGHGGQWTGLLNTAWTRVSVDVVGIKEGQSLEIDEANLPALSIRVTHKNVHTHLEGVKRQGGGIGSAAYDSKQSDIRSFFGGGLTTQGKKDEQREEGRSASNVYDEVGVEIEDD